MIKIKPTIFLIMLFIGFFLFFVLFKDLLKVDILEKETENNQNNHIPLSESLENSKNILKNEKFYQIKPNVIMALPVSGQIRYVSLNIVVMLKNYTSIDLMEKNASLIKNSLIDLFSKQTFDQMTKENEREEIQKKALLALQSLLNKESGESVIEIDKVLLTSFVLK